MKEAWDLSDERGFLSWYDATVREASRYAARLCRGEVDHARDLVQEAYLAVLHRARSSSLTATGAGLIVTAIRNRFIDQMRRTDAEQRSLRLVASVPPADPSSATGSELTAGLSERARTAMILRYVDGWSVPDIAEALALTVHATESVLSRAKAQIRRGVQHG